MSETRSFRDALGRYPTGVAIVTAHVDGVAVGITVNSFASVSLDPPLVLWSIEKATERYARFRDADRFAINVLASDQADLAHACALEPRLRECRATWSGAIPLLDGAIARFECTRDQVYPGGDHDIILGRVDKFDTPRDAPALVFYQGGYSQPG